MFFSESAAWVMIFQLLFERIFQVTAHCSSILAQAAHLYKSVQDGRVNLSEWVWSSLAFVNQRWRGLNTIPFGSSRSCDAEQACCIICVIHLYKSLFQRTDSSFQEQHNQQTRYLLYYILTLPFSLSSPSFPIKRTFYLPHLPGWRRCCAPRRKISKRRVDQQNDQSKPASMRPYAQQNPQNGMLKIGFYSYL